VLSPSPHGRRITDSEAYRYASAFLIETEGMVLAVYPDTAGYATGGVGHKMRKGDVAPTTVEQALDLLRRDISEHAQCVERFRDRLNAMQFAALVSFVFNIGCSRFEAASCSVRLALEANTLEGVPDLMRRYHKRRDQKTNLLVVDRGLVNRREHEIKLWKGEWSWKQWEAFSNSSSRA
jgi:GH24 family phage-related lysozyme (muramidase)